MTPQQLQTEIKRVLDLDALRTQGEWYLDYSDLLRNPSSPLLVRSKVEGLTAHIADTYQRNRPHDANFIARAPFMVEIIRELLSVVEKQREFIAEDAEHNRNCALIVGAASIDWCDCGLDEIVKLFSPLVEKLNAATKGDE